MKIQLVGTLRFAHPAILNPKGGRGERVLACVPNGILMTKPFASAHAVTAGSMPEQWHVDNGRLSCLSSMSPAGTFKTCRDVRSSVAIGGNSGHGGNSVFRSRLTR